MEFEIPKGMTIDTAILLKKHLNIREAATEKAMEELAAQDYKAAIAFFAANLENDAIVLMERLPLVFLKVIEHLNKKYKEIQSQKEPSCENS